MSDTNQPSKHGHIGRLVAATICIAVAALLFVNRQYVVDQISVWQYKPSSAIAALAERSSMNDQGRFYFYASQPALETAESFNKECDRKENSTAILGCYNGRTIHIYSVTDERLAGIREVTAAHEMLHAAYDRIDETTRQSINILLEAEYAKLKDDKAFSERMAFYARTEPGQRDNELHSVIGTEVTTISPELEIHYKKYFDDRSKVVNLHIKYASIFEQLQTRSEKLSTQLTALGNGIEEDSITYNKEVTDLNSDIEAFNERAQSDEGFSTQEEFQNERASLVERASQLNAQRANINEAIAQYESLRQELTTIASQSEALNRSINSSLAPAPSL